MLLILLCFFAPAACDVYTFAELTHTVCVIQPEAGEHLVQVSGMEKSAGTHHYLETL